MDLPSLYKEDQVAWLERSAKLIKQKRYKDLDYKHLVTYLNEWARRDRLDVMQRLRRLLLYRLKWDYCPPWRTRIRAGAVLQHQHELEIWTDTPTLKAYAKEVLHEAYAKAARRAAKQMRLGRARFPAECPYTIEGLIKGYSHAKWNKDLADFDRRRAESRGKHLTTAKKP